MSPKTHFPAPVLRQVFPARVHFFDERNLLLPPPSLQLFLSPDCLPDVVKTFVVNKAAAAVLLGESLCEALLMLVRARTQEASDPGVQRGSPSGHHVHPVLVKTAITHVSEEW